ncbi:glycosyltransferase family 4 protein [Verrucomicrobiota bacterium]
MKIIMDFRKYDGVIGGVEQGALQITKHVARKGGEVLLACKEIRKNDVRHLFDSMDGITVVPIPISSHSISVANARIDSGFFQDLAEREGADLIHFFYNWSFPFRKKVPSVLTIHDVIPFTFREAMGAFRNRFIYKPSLRMACRLNNVITTVSEYSKKDISEKTGTPLSKINVIYNGLRNPDTLDSEIKIQLEKKFNLENGCILNVGGIHERKNIPRLIEAFAEFVKNKGYKGNLLITGSVSGAPYQEKMKKICDEAITRANMKGRVIFTGFISEKELDILLEIADVFIYPSLYEGFGIPILESMQAGTPVITSAATAMPEVADGAAILVDPYNVEQMALELSRVLCDKSLRNDLIAKGKKRARTFSWEKNGGEYMDLYKKVIEKGMVDA